jgi:hypothetical protein
VLLEVHNVLLEVHNGGSQKDLQILPDCVCGGRDHRGPSDRNTGTPKLEQDGNMCGVGVVGESSADVSLSWLESIGACYSGSPATQIKHDFPIDYHLGEWSRDFGVNLIAGIVH